MGSDRLSAGRDPGVQPLSHGGHLQRLESGRPGATSGFVLHAVACLPGGTLGDGHGHHPGPRPHVHHTGGNEHQPGQGHGRRAAGAREPVF